MKLARKDLLGQDCSYLQVAVLCQMEMALRYLLTLHVDTPRDLQVAISLLSPKIDFEIFTGIRDNFAWQKLVY